jgi:hypothetical protein
MNKWLHERFAMVSGEALCPEGGHPCPVTMLWWPENQRNSMGIDETKPTQEMEGLTTFQKVLRSKDASFW